MLWSLDRGRCLGGGGRCHWPGLLGETVIPPPFNLSLAILSYRWRELVVVVPDNRRRQKRGVRVPSTPNPRPNRDELANETARAAEREGINVADDVLHELRKCIKRGGGSNISGLRQMITEHLLMYFKVYRQRPPSKRIRQNLEKLRKAIERLQRAMPRADDPTYRLLSDRWFAWAHYAGRPQWTDFHLLAAKSDEKGLADLPDVLELAHQFIATAEKLIGSSRAKKHVGLDKLVFTLAAEWRFLTGKYPASGRDPVTNKQSGPFADFVRCAMQALPNPLRSQPVDSAIRSVCDEIAKLRVLRK
jgi:hypothetical protein